MAIDRDRSGDGIFRLVLEEAYALGLLGRFDDALRVLEESQIEAQAGAAACEGGLRAPSTNVSERETGDREAARLCRARLLLARGDGERGSAGGVERSRSSRAASGDSPNAITSGDEPIASTNDSWRVEAAGGAAGPGPESIDLQRAAASHPSPFTYLEALAAERTPASWRAQLALARAARAAGRVPDAAALLRDSIREFRDQTAGESSPAVSALAKVLSDEVSGLHRSADSAPRLLSASAPERGSLLRLVDLGKRLAAETDPDQVLRIVLHEAIELTGTERGFVVLVSGEDFEFALAENLDWSEVEKPTFEVSRTLIRKVLQDGKPLLLALPDAGATEAAHKSLAEIGARSVACIPIVHEDKPLGVLYLDGRDPSHSFRQPLERLLGLLADQAGAALENARKHSAKTHALEAAEESLRRQRSTSQIRIGYGEIVGASQEMQEVYRKLDLITPTEMPVLVLGETGTGKEIVARLIHARGPRAGREFVATNCAGIAESLLEAEIFGHERGAFTGADRTRPGLFELARDGTIFLDEVGDMSLRMQADLLRVLQSGEVRRIGGRETLHVNVRVIAATHRDLEDLMRRGEFRQDFYYRLNVLSVRLPALRERAVDIPLFVAEMMKRVVPEGRTPPRVSERAMRRLMTYSWPGNVRELENILRRVSVLGIDVIDERHLPDEILRSSSKAVRAGSMRRAEDEAVREALAASRGNKAGAARILGVDRKTLYARLRRLGAGSATRRR